MIVRKGKNIVDGPTREVLAACVDVRTARAMMASMTSDKKYRHDYSIRRCAFIRDLMYRCAELVRSQPAPIYVSGTECFLFAKIARERGMMAIDIASLLERGTSTVHYYLHERQEKEGDTDMLNILRKEFCHERD